MIASIKSQRKMSQNEKKGHGGNHTRPKKWPGARRPAGPATTALVMDIVFQPPQVKSYSVDICMVCDNCNVKHLSIKGKYYCEP